MKTLLLFLWGVLLLTGCASQTITRRTVRADDIHGIPVVQNPVIANLDVKPHKIMGEAIMQISESEEDAKQNAIADALDKGQADILIRLMDSTDIKRLSAIDATKKVDAYEPAAVTEKTSYTGAITLMVLLN